VFSLRLLFIISRYCISRHPSAILFLFLSLGWLVGKVYSGEICIGVVGIILWIWISLLSREEEEEEEEKEREV
jgi:protein-S-isoprenylcysteine O-methyltransferase Ste14